MELPPPRPQFMIRDRFEVRADLFPLGAVYNGRLEQEHFLADHHYDREIALKLDALEHEPNRVRQIATGRPEDLTAAIWRVFSALAEDAPGVARVDPTGVTLVRHGLRLQRSDDDVVVQAIDPTPLGARIRRWLERQHGLPRLLDCLALACQEDLVIVRGGDGDAEDAAEALHVCFPSGWDPREKVGRTFAAIHEPIAENQRLIAASPNVVKAILTKGPYVRHAWGLTLSPELDAHPARKRVAFPELATPAEIVERTFLRMERQTTLAMPELDRGLFTIRVSVEPLAARLAADPELGARVARLLRSMSPEVLAYKGMSRIAPAVLAWLEP